MSEHKGPSAPDAADALNAGESVDVVCVGEVAWDVRPSDAGPLELASSFAFSPGGGALNTALEIARLGGRAALAAAFGDDPIGRGLARRVLEAGVDDRFFCFAPVRTGLVFVGASLEGQRRFVSYRSPDDEASALEPALPRSLGARVVHLSGVVPTPAVKKLFSRAIDAAIAGSALISLDLNARPRFFGAKARGLPEGILGAAHIIKTTGADLRAMGLSSVADLRPYARTNTVIIATSGAGPVRASGPFGLIERSPVPIDGVDPAGAGDAFCAGLLVELARAPARSDQGAPLDAALLGRALDRAMEAARAHLERRLKSSA